MFLYHLIHGSSRRESMKILFHYMFYTGAVMLSVGIMVGMENSFDALTIGIITVASLMMLVSVVGGRDSA